MKKPCTQNFIKDASILKTMRKYGTWASQQKRLFEVKRGKGIFLHFLDKHGILRVSLV